MFMSGRLTDEFDLTPVIDVHGKDINVTFFLSYDMPFVPVCMRLFGKQRYIQPQL